MQSVHEFVEEKMKTAAGRIELYMLAPFYSFKKLKPLINKYFWIKQGHCPKCGSKLNLFASKRYINDRGKAYITGAYITCFKCGKYTKHITDPEYVLLRKRGDYNLGLHTEPKIDCRYLLILEERVVCSRDLGECHPHDCIYKRSTLEVAR